MAVLPGMRRYTYLASATKDEPVVMTARTMYRPNSSCAMSLTLNPALDTNDRRCRADGDRRTSPMTEVARSSVFPSV